MRSFVWLIIGLAAAGCSHAAPEQAPAAKQELPTLQAAVLEVQPQAWPAVVGAKVAGRIDEVGIDLGDEVAEGAVLATLDREEFELEVVLAEAQLTQSRAALGLAPADPVEKLNPYNAPPVREARAVLDEIQARIQRIRQLRVSNAVTKDELELAIASEGVADARYAAAVNGVREKIAQISVRAAELSVAKDRLSDTEIVAPFDGLVEQRHVARGSYVQVGDPIVTLVRTKTLRFRGTMPERHAQKLAIGQQVSLRIESIAEPRVAVVTRLSPGLDEMSRALTFEAVIDNPGDLRAGLFAEGDVVVDPEGEALAVPAAAVVEFAGAEKVWKVVDGITQEQVVQTMRRTGGLVEIVEGLGPGDTILASGAEGRIARIQPTSIKTADAPLAGDGARAEGHAGLDATGGSGAAE
jgi:RND family efflux transporter MFP subunit